MTVESLLDLNRKKEEIYIQKGLFYQFDGFIAWKGKQKTGKSSLWPAYYKIFYSIDREIINISNASLSLQKDYRFKKKRKGKKLNKILIKILLM